MTSTRTARFSTSDLDWFASVGHDKNPLHLDEAYARKSSFGGRLVHGVLAALTSLAALPPRTGHRLRRVVFEFRHEERTSAARRLDAPRSRDGGLCTERE